MWIWIRIFAEWLKHKQRKSFIRILGLIERNRENYIIFSVGMANILRISQGWCVVCCWIQKSVENILSEFLFKICLQSIIWLVQTSKTNQCFFQLLEEQISHWAVSSFSLVSGECAQQTWHMTHDTWAMSRGHHLGQEITYTYIKTRSIF